MQVLRELVLFVDRHAGSKANLIAHQLSPKLVQLYEGILNEGWASDEEAVQHLYPKRKISSSAYRKLKMTLKQRLVDVLLAIDIHQSEASDRQKAYQTCHKEWAAAKLLLGKGARVSGIEFGTKVLREAEKYEFTDLCRDICALLRVHYGTMVGDVAKFDYYNDAYKEFDHLCRGEDLAEEFYTRLIMQYVNSRSIDQSTHRQAKAYFEQIEPLLNNFGSYRLHLYGRLIQTIIYNSINDHRATLQVCAEAIEFFKNKAYDTQVPLQIFYYQMLEDYIALKQFRQGIAISNKLKKTLESGSFNWFKYQELSFLLSTHNRRYRQALEVFLEVVCHRRFQLLPAHVQETWKIFRAYLCYLIETRAIRAPRDVLGSFKMGRFLNDIPVFSKDKSGMNIAILIIQILFSLLEKEHGNAAEQIESIRKYCARHLTDGNTRRSYYFIKMLLQIPKGSFDKETVLQRVEPALEKLHAVPLELSNQSLEIEVVPYEALWELALASLERRTSNFTA